MPCVYDPGKPGSPSLFGFADVASAFSTTSALTTSALSGLNRPAAHSLSTLRSGGRPPPTQDSLPGGAATPFLGGTGYPQGSITKFQPWLSVHGFPLIQASWRTENRPGVYLGT